MNTKQYAPAVHKFLNYLLAFVTIPLFLSFFDYSLGLRTGLWAIIFVAFALFSAGISTLRKGYRPARYFLIAWAALIGGFVTIVLRTFAILPNMFLTEYGVQIGSAMEVTLLSLGLADRINQERKEKIVAQQIALEAKEEAVKNLEKASRLKSRFLAITEAKVKERTEALNETLCRVEEANLQIVDSIRYARMIQKSLLPDGREIKQCLKDCFVIWKPRDIVGGDIFFFDFFEDEFIVAVIDCTGHGVPGAFMTMIASSGLKRIIRDENRRSPADILKRLNFIVKTTLRQDTEYAASDDGLDAAVCWVRSRKRVLHFAGARLPLLGAGKGNVRIAKGDRKSIGYRDSDLSFEFEEKIIPIKADMCFYLSTDGFIDQLGGPKGISFGKRRLMNILAQNYRKPCENQKEILLKAFNKYKGDFDRIDDITVVGFRPDN